LVVVDTGREPSAFFQKVAIKDPSVVYRYYPVSDSKHDRLQAWARLRNPNRNIPAPMMYEPAPNVWSLGLKRNVAAATAAGCIMAHFDDDDLYSPEYLSHMVRKLREQAKFSANVSAQAVAEDAPEAADAPACRSDESIPAEPPGDGERDDLAFEVPALVTLKEWHLFDFSGLRFRHIDPATDPDVPHSWRKAMMMGYGFSYVYTRAAWELQAFPDREDCEDDIFIEKLQKKRAEAVGLIPLPSKEAGLVAHSFHTDNTGMSEFNGNKRLGQLISRPRAFDKLMPIVAEITKQLAAPRPELSWLFSGARQGWSRGGGQGVTWSDLRQSVRHAGSGKVPVAAARLPLGWPCGQGQRKVPLPPSSRDHIMNRINGIARSAHTARATVLQ